MCVFVCVCFSVCLFWFFLVFVAVVGNTLCFVIALLRHRLRMAAVWLKSKLNIKGPTESTESSEIDGKTLSKIVKYITDQVALVSNKKLNLKNSPPYLQGLCLSPHDGI